MADRLGRYRCCRSGSRHHAARGCRNRHRHGVGLRLTGIDGDGSPLARWSRWSRRWNRRRRLSRSRRSGLTGKGRWGWRCRYRWIHRRCRLRSGWPRHNGWRGRPLRRRRTRWGQNRLACQDRGVGWKPERLWPVVGDPCHGYDSPRPRDGLHREPPRPPGDRPRRHVTGCLNAVDRHLGRLHRHRHDVLLGSCRSHRAEQPRRQQQPATDPRTGPRQVDSNQKPGGAGHQITSPAIGEPEGLPNFSA